MARGFESKSVESQQQDRERRETPGQIASPETPATRARRQTLSLSLARARADLAAASAPAHRKMLEAAIAELQKQLSEL